MCTCSSCVLPGYESSDSKSLCRTAWYWSQHVSNPHSASYANASHHGSKHPDRQTKDRDQRVQWDWIIVYYTKMINPKGNNPATFFVIVFFLIITMITDAVHSHITTLCQFKGVTFFISKLAVHHTEVKLARK